MLASIVPARSSMYGFLILLTLNDTMTSMVVANISDKKLWWFSYPWQTDLFCDRTCEPILCLRPPRLRRMTPPDLVSSVFSYDIICKRPCQFFLSWDRSAELQQSFHTNTQRFPLPKSRVKSNQKSTAFENEAIAYNNVWRFVVYLLIEGPCNTRWAGLFLVVAYLRVLSMYHRERDGVLFPWQYRLIVQMCKMCSETCRG